MSTEMPKGNEDDNLLLGIFPSFRRTPEQVARWYGIGESPTCKLLRDPISLQELNEYNHEIAIWRENHTLTYVSPQNVSNDNRHKPKDKRRMLSLDFGKTGPILHIAGETDEVVAETAAFFMTLDAWTEESTSLLIRSSHNLFNFCAARSHCFTRLSEVAPSCHVTLQSMILSVDQLNVLATRPRPIQLILCECQFEDEGTSFVDALAKRQSSFGSLIFGNNVFNDENMNRLFQVEVIEHLGLPHFQNHDENGLLHLSAKVDSLDCFIFPPSLMIDLNSVNIVANRLSLNFEQCEIDDFPTEPILSFFRHLADLGQFVELAITFYFDDCADFDIPDCVVQELINTALANRNLQVLDLKTMFPAFDWSPHSWRLFAHLEGHKALRTLRISVDNEDEAFGPNFCFLQRFLSCNRYVTVTNTEGNVFTDGWCIDEIYCLNQFYRGSKSLVVESLSDRSLLVATALIESASIDVQRSALLMSDHTDTLCDLIQFAQLDDLDEDDLPMPRSHQDQKRQRRM